MVLFFQLTSQYRNRNRNQKQGKFAVFPNGPVQNKANALDPVSLAAPSRMFRAGFSFAGTVVSASAHEHQDKSTIVLSTVLDEQSQTDNFLCGCILSSPTDPLLLSRITKSKAIGPTELLINVRGFPIFQVGQIVTISDYTSFNPLYVRAPGWEDLAGFLGIIYNETLEQSLKIKAMDIDTRELTFEETSAVGWSTAHQLTLRSAVPTTVVQVTGQVGNVLTTNIPLGQDNVGDWLRLRLVNYQTDDPDLSWTRKIIAVVGNQVTLFPMPPLTLVGSMLELLAFSYDNAQAVTVNDQSSTMIWEARLESLIVPNVDIFFGSLKSIPHLLIGLQNQHATISNKNVVNTNNPAVQQYVFEAKIPTISQDMRFVSCDLSNQCSKRLILNIREPICLLVWLPNGQEFDTVLSDNVNPVAAVPDLQISATFSLEPIYKAHQMSGGTIPDNVPGNIL